MRASIAVPRPCASAHVARRLRGRSLRFANSRSARSVVVVDVHGDVDASNTNELTAYVGAVRGPDDDVVLDLRGVEFLGAEGFLALETITRGCGAPTRLAVVPSPAVARLLGLCTSAPAISLPPTSMPRWPRCGGRLRAAPQLHAEALSPLVASRQKSPRSHSANAVTSIFSCEPVVRTCWLARLGASPSRHRPTALPGRLAPACSRLRCALLEHP